MRALATVLLAALAIAGCGASTDSPGASSTGQAFDAERAFADLRAQVRLGPRPSGSAAAREAERLIVRGLRQAGAEGVTVQRPYRNVIATIPGSSDETIVVGAHYDTKSGIPSFVGANDGASGVGLLLELARTLPNPMPGPSITLVFFDAEEARGDRSFERDGTRGSRQFVADAVAGGRDGAPPRDRIAAMVLFDMIGDCDLRIPLERFSSPELYRSFAAPAAGGPQPFTGRSAGIEDDHIPFLRAGIQSLDLIDFDYGPGPVPGAWWHTRRDTLAHVCAASLDSVGEAALRALPAIG